METVITAAAPLSQLCGSQVSHLNEPSYSSILAFPPELLAKIVANTLDPPALVDPIFNPSGNAMELLNISHVSSFFRQVTVGEPALWAMAPYLNAVHQDFLETILERSQPYTFNLSFMEDGSLTEDDQIWRLALSHFHRVSRLHIEAMVVSEGDLLVSLFSKSAPSLTECIIQFFGNRTVALCDLSSHPFNDDAPNLRKLDLTNCSVRVRHYPAFAALRDVTVVHLVDEVQHDDRTLLPIDDFIQCRNKLNSLQSLTLHSCIQDPDPESSTRLSSQDSIYLPSLKHFVLKSTIDGCHGLGKILRLPETCSRSITVTFPLHWEPEQLGDAVRAAEAVASFIPSLEYTVCAGGIRGSVPSMRLFIAGQRYPTVTIRFGISAPDAHPDMDLFLLQVGRGLASTLATPLSTIKFLHMHLDGVKTSLVGYLLRPLIKIMKNLEEFVAQGPDVWANGTIVWILDYSIAPNLKKLRVPLDDMMHSAAALRGTAQFLLVRPEIREVTFGVSPSITEEMGHAASDGIRCLIRDVSKDFPGSLVLDWIELQ
ncbi:hypothetical protein DFP72DRAFT_856348 [Ephemerocybe angulata]|uniref:F-box domain-containing protein n=1 Tax=Ephemerocybe angulata TaxID=980116 RepID=A0A8H6HGU6_9AGAR|nr:hypothetical protein DFP72DRAFT_856348 [Tulosesus angulatus]